MNKEYSIPNFVLQLLTESSKGVEPLLDKLSTILSCPVLVTDSFYQPYCSTNNIDLTEIMIVPNKDLECNSIFACEITTRDTITSGLSTPISLNQKPMGFLVMFCEYNTPKVDLYEQILPFSASLCALQIQKKLEIKQEKCKFKDAFLFDLLYGNIKKKQDIIEYGLLWDWDFTVPYLVIVFSFVEDDHFFTNQVKVNILQQLVEKELIRQQLDSITMVKQGNVIALVPQQTPDIMQFRSKIEVSTNQILSQAIEIKLEPEIACGLGKVYPNPAELFRSYQEAKVAFELGVLLKTRTPFFDELGLERILFRHDLQDLKEYFNYCLGALINYEKDHEGNLLETLEALAANQFDMGKTAVAIFLHRNTLRYRVKKIEEILNVKLDDFHFRLNIIAAFKIKQLRKL